MSKTPDRDRRLLEHVAALCGIEASYEDMFGAQHEVEDEVLKALLSGCGYAAQTPRDLLEVLEVIRGSSACRVVEPVQVVAAETRPIAITLTIAESFSHGRYQWRLLRENGSEARGEGCLSELQTVDELSIRGGRVCRRVLLLGESLECGYHDVEIRLSSALEEKTARQRLIVRPRRAYLPEGLRGEKRLWGLTAQLYGVRSEHNWGIGSFSDLRRLIDWAADLGAAFVGINPLNLLFMEDPSKVSPYGPSSRRFNHPWYLDLEAVPEFWESEAVRRWCGEAQIQEACKAHRRSPLVEYEKVWPIQWGALHRLYDHFQEKHLKTNSDRAQAFHRFVESGGVDLEHYGVFHALDAHFRRLDRSSWGWHLWPAPYREVGSPQVRGFAVEHAETVRFYQYVAWNVREQLAACGHRSWERGLPVGLYGDLPVGVEPWGLDTWQDPTLYALKIRLGAPPDGFNPKGQEWGVCPFLPRVLREKAYEPFVAMLRANMRDFGALRIDHVMGLMRQFWIPEGQDARYGAYVRYPFEDLLGIVLLESQRNRCAVVGEDLGTVPPRVRAAMEENGIFGCRLCFFERAEDGSFPRPEDYPEWAMVSFATHDLPTLEGFWRGTDLRLRERLHLYPSTEVRRQMARGRAADRKALRTLLRSWGFEDPGAREKQGCTVEDEESRSVARAAAVYRYLSASRSKLLSVSMEDLCGMTDQVNVPGTVSEHPNWRRKLPLDIESLREHPRVRAILSAVAEQRS